MKKISIIIPCYNENKTISKIIFKILNLKKLNKEIIVVDDFSIDGSREIIKELEKKGYVKAIYHKKNMGKGACIISATKKIKGDIVIIQDADLEYYPSDIIKIYKKLINSDFKAIYGSRILKKKYFENLKNFSHWIRIIGNILLTFLSNLISPFILSVYTLESNNTTPLLDINIEFKVSNEYNKTINYKIHDIINNTDKNYIRNHIKQLNAVHSNDLITINKLLTE